MTMLPTLASNERMLVICESDPRIISWCVIVKTPLTRLYGTTPGMARKPTFTASITVD